MQFHFFAEDAKFFVGIEKKKATIFFSLMQTTFPLTHIQMKNFTGQNKFLLIQERIFQGELKSSSIASRKKFQMKRTVKNRKMISTFLTL